MNIGVHLGTNMNACHPITVSFTSYVSSIAGRKNETVYAAESMDARKSRVDDIEHPSAQAAIAVPSDCVSEPFPGLVTLAQCASRCQPLAVSTSPDSYRVQQRHAQRNDDDCPQLHERFALHRGSVTVAASERQQIRTVAGHAPFFWRLQRPGAAIAISRSATLFETPNDGSEPRPPKPADARRLVRG